MGGDNLYRAFQDLNIPKEQAQLVYTAKDNDYQIWEISKEALNTLYAVPNPRWSSKKWGWWIYSKPSITTYPVEKIKVNNIEINAWVNPKIKDRRFSSLKDYSNRMWNIFLDHEFMQLAVNLTTINSKNLEELVRYCGE